jgi:hypothetical protein
MGAHPPLVDVTEVRVVGEHLLNLRFEDGASGELDFKGWSWRGVFAPLENPDYFAKVQVDHEIGTIAWPNGADIAPETLHQWALHGQRPSWVRP